MAGGGLVVAASLLRQPATLVAAKLLEVHYALHGL
ncbi:hypothetical protein OROMI_027427 [Orobanche minor]